MERKKVGNSWCCADGQGEWLALKLGRQIIVIAPAFSKPGHFTTQSTHQFMEQSRPWNSPKQRAINPLTVVIESMFARKVTNMQGRSAASPNCLTMIFPGVREPVTGSPAEVGVSQLPTAGYVNTSLSR